LSYEGISLAGRGDLPEQPKYTAHGEKRQGAHSEYNKN